MTSPTLLSLPSAIRVASSIALCGLLPTSRPDLRPLRALGISAEITRQSLIAWRQSSNTTRRPTSSSVTNVQIPSNLRVFFRIIPIPNISIISCATNATDLLTNAAMATSTLYNAIAAPKYSWVPVTTLAVSGDLQTVETPFAISHCQMFCKHTTLLKATSTAMNVSVLLSASWETHVRGLNLIQRKISSFLLMMFVGTVHDSILSLFFFLLLATLEKKLKCKIVWSHQARHRILTGCPRLRVGS
jgi:hypothetical protein